MRHARRVFTPARVHGDGTYHAGLVQRFDAAEHVGYLTSAYPLGMFGALFFWPQLSDKIGRKPIIVTSLMGVGVGLILQALCVRSGWSLQTFLGWRAVRRCGGESGGEGVSRGRLDARVFTSVDGVARGVVHAGVHRRSDAGWDVIAGFSLSAAISVTGGHPSPRRRWCCYS